MDKVPDIIAMMLAGEIGEEFFREVERQSKTAVFSHHANMTPPEELLFGKNDNNDEIKK